MSRLAAFFRCERHHFRCPSAQNDKPIVRRVRGSDFCHGHPHFTARDAVRTCSPSRRAGVRIRQSLLQAFRTNDRSRRNRIAAGSGTDPAEINDVLKQFKGMSGMMQKMAGLSMKDKMKAVNELAPEMMNPGAQMRREKQRSKRGPADKNSVRDKRKLERQRAKQARKKNKRRK